MALGQRKRRPIWIALSFSTVSGGRVQNTPHGPKRMPYAHTIPYNASVNNWLTGTLTKLHAPRELTLKPKSFQTIKMAEPFTALALQLPF